MGRRGVRVKRLPRDPCVGLSCVSPWRPATSWSFRALVLRTVTSGGAANWVKRTRLLRIIYQTCVLTCSCLKCNFFKVQICLPGPGWFPWEGYIFDKGRVKPHLCCLCQRRLGNILDSFKPQGQDLVVAPSSCIFGSPLQIQVSRLAGRSLISYPAFQSIPDVF